jgi:hypothetical protein
MTWHKNGKRYNPDKMVHVSDGEAWKHFDVIHREKAEEARNIRVALSIYGFNPYGIRQMGTNYDQSRPNRKTMCSRVFTPSLDDVNYFGRIEEIYELNFHGSKPVTPVIFKCHWFDPQVMRWTHSNLGIVEIRQDSTLPGDNVYIVVQ